MSNYVVNCLIILIQLIIPACSVLIQEWSFLLAPGWSSLEDYSIAKIATHQWKSANSYIMNDLKKIPAQNWCFVRYSDELGAVDISGIQQDIIDIPE